MASTDPSLLARIFSPGPTRDNHPASGATGKAGRNLAQAITTAVVLIAAVAVPLFTSLPAFVGVIAFVCLVGIWELAGAFARMGITLAVTPLYVGAIGMVTCAWWLGSEGMLFALYITVFVCAAWRLLDRRQESRMSDVVSTTFTAAYVPSWPRSWCLCSARGVTRGCSWFSRLMVIAERYGRLGCRCSVR